MGFKTIINNRPDKETDDQPMSQELVTEAAKNGMVLINQPVISGNVTRQDAANFATELKRVKGPVLAFCRTGTRCTVLWALNEARHMDADVILSFAASIGYDLKGQRETFAHIAAQASGSERIIEHKQDTYTYDVVIVGGGSAGIATAASLLKRRPGLDIVVIEPRYKHFYQPGFTMVGGGIFDPAQPQAFTDDVMPAGVRWIRTAAQYDGYGSCPLTVERGKIVLAEYGYDGKLLPTFPAWLIKSDEASKAAWFLKEKLLPTVYYQLMLKGREWLAKPRKPAKKP